MTLVTGGPQRKVTTPPLATARTTAAEVQLAAVPLPMAAAGSRSVRVANHFVPALAVHRGQYLAAGGVDHNHPASEYHPYWPPGSGAQGGEGGGRVTTVVRREEGRDLCPRRQLRASLPRKPGR